MEINIFVEGRKRIEPETEGRMPKRKYQQELRKIEKKNNELKEKMENVLLKMSSNNEAVLSRYYHRNHFMFFLCHIFVRMQADKFFVWYQSVNGFHYIESISYFVLFSVLYLAHLANGWHSHVYIKRINLYSFYDYSVHFYLFTILFYVF